MSFGDGIYPIQQVNEHVHEGFTTKVSVVQTNSQNLEVWQENGLKTSSLAMHDIRDILPISMKGIFGRQIYLVFIPFMPKRTTKWDPFVKQLLFVTPNGAPPVLPYLL